MTVIARDLTVNVKEIRALANMLKVASVPARLRIIYVLAEGDATAGRIAAAVGGKNPTVSYNLKLLRISRLAELKRSGNRRVFALTDKGRSVFGIAQALFP